MTFFPHAPPNATLDNQWHVTLPWALTDVRQPNDPDHGSATRFESATHFRIFVDLPTVISALLQNLGITKAGPRHTVNWPPTFVQVPSCVSWMAPRQLWQSQHDKPSNLKNG